MRMSCVISFHDIERFFPLIIVINMPELSEDKKKLIESLSTDEMACEINLGRLSRFQRKKFAYLKTCYQLRLSKENKKFSGEQSVAKNKASEKTHEKHNPMLMPSKKNQKRIDPFRIAEGVIIGVLVLCVAWVLLHYFGLTL